MQSIALRIGIFVLIGVGALVARPFLMGAAGDLKVGECFDLPASASETIEDVQHHPCSDAHDGEVFFVGELPIAAGAAYPSDEALGPLVDTLCMPAFAAYTGLKADTDPLWSFGAGVPVDADWEDGNRRLMCYATRVDGTRTSGSIKTS